MKALTLRRDGVCCLCGAALPAGTRGLWDASLKTVQCAECPRRSTPVALDVLPEPVAVAPSQRAGASAQRQYDLKAERREAAVRARHPRLGGLLLALTNEPVKTRVWAQGAAGERAVAAKLAELEGDHVCSLHDRRMIREDGRSSRANIDHLVVAASAVWVIDAKTHHGSLEVRRSGGLFSPRVEELWINGRNQTKLLDGLERQVTAVRRVLNEVDADVPVRGGLCFVGTDMPWITQTVRGVPMLTRRSMAKLMREPGELGARERQAVAEFLDRRFVPA